MKKRNTRESIPELTKEQLRIAHKEFRIQMAIVRAQIASATLDDIRKLVEK